MPIHSFLEYIQIICINEKTGAGSEFHSFAANSLDVINLVPNFI